MTQTHHQLLTVLLTPDTCEGQTIPHIVWEMKHIPKAEHHRVFDDTISVSKKRTPKGGKLKVNLRRREPERFAPFLIPDPTQSLLQKEALFMTIGDHKRATQSGE